MHCFLSEVPSILCDRLYKLMSHSYGTFGGGTKVLYSTIDLHLDGCGTSLLGPGEGSDRGWTPGDNITLSLGAFRIVPKCHWGLMAISLHAPQELYGTVCNTFISPFYSEFYSYSVRYTHLYLILTAVCNYHVIQCCAVILHMGRLR